MFNFFKNKKQEAAVKAINLPVAEKTVTKSLGLSSLQINYNIMYKKAYSAKVTYKENPKEWGNEGVVEEIEIEGNSWAELLDKISAHFGENNELSND